MSDREKSDGDDGDFRPNDADDRLDEDDGEELAERKDYNSGEDDSEDDDDGDFSGLEPEDDDDGDAGAESGSSNDDEDYRGQSSRRKVRAGAGRGEKAKKAAAPAVGDSRKRARRGGKEVDTTKTGGSLKRRRTEQRRASSLSGRRFVEDMAGEASESESEDSENLNGAEPGFHRGEGGIDYFAARRSGVREDTRSVEEIVKDVEARHGHHLHRYPPLASGYRLPSKPVGTRAGATPATLKASSGTHPGDEAADAAAGALLEEGISREAAFRRGVAPMDSLVQASVAVIPDNAKLFMVRTRVNRERNAVSDIMMRFMQRYNTDRPLLIHSATARDGVKGYIYVEAKREADVKLAIEGLNSVVRASISLVPRGEIEAIYAVSKKQAAVTEGQWARIKRGVYTGDLCQIVSVLEGGDQVVIRCIPRLDFDLIKKGLKQSQSASAAASASGETKKNVRPAARFFDPETIAKISATRPVKKGVDTYLFDNAKFVDGYLHKTVKISTLLLTDVAPSLEELSQFHKGKLSAGAEFGAGGGEAQEEEDEVYGGIAKLTSAAVMSTALSNAAKSLKKGDVVRVREGDARNMIGTIRKLQPGNILEVVPKDRLLAMTIPGGFLQFSANEVEKWFMVNDHVKVTDGVHKGRTGTVTGIVTATGAGMGGINRAFVTTDSGMEEIEVFTRDLELTHETSAGVGAGGNGLAAGSAGAGLSSSAAGAAAGSGAPMYSIYDMIKLTADNMGVIVGVDRDMYRVLDQKGNIVSLRADQMGPVERLNNFANDRFGNAVQKKDMVKILEGLHKGRIATVRHVWRSHLFVSSPESIRENAGLFVVRGTQTCLCGGSSTGAVGGAKGGGAAGFYTSQATGPTGYMVSGPSGASASLMGGSSSSMSHMASAAAGGGKNLVMMGKRVRITRGPYKGYVGKIVSASESKCRVEAEARLDSYDVDLKDVIEVDEENRPLVRSAVAAAAMGMYGAGQVGAVGAGAGGRSAMDILRVSGAAGASAYGGGSSYGAAMGGGYGGYGGSAYGAAAGAGAGASGGYGGNAYYGGGSADYGQSQSSYYGSAGYGANGAPASAAAGDQYATSYYYGGNMPKTPSVYAAGSASAASGAASLAMGAATPVHGMLDVFHAGMGDASHHLSSSSSASAPAAAPVAAASATPVAASWGSGTPGIAGGTATGGMGDVPTGYGSMPGLGSLSHTGTVSAGAAGALSSHLLYGATPSMPSIYQPPPLLLQQQAGAYGSSSSSSTTAAAAAAAITTSAAAAASSNSSSNSTSTTTVSTSSATYGDPMPSAYSTASVASGGPSAYSGRGNYGIYGGYGSYGGGSGTTDNSSSSSSVVGGFGSVPSWCIPGSVVRYSDKMVRIVSSNGMTRMATVISVDDHDGAGSAGGGMSMTVPISQLTDLS